MVAQSQIMQKLVKATNFKMTFQATKNMGNHNKAVNFIIINKYESLIEIAELSLRNFKNVWACKLKYFGSLYPVAL